MEPTRSVRKIRDEKTIDSPTMRMDHTNSTIPFDILKIMFKEQRGKRVMGPLVNVGHGKMALRQIFRFLKGYYFRDLNRLQAGFNLHTTYVTHTIIHITTHWHIN
jgi:hypothetical protein